MTSIKKDSFYLVILHDNIFAPRWAPTKMPGAYAHKDRNGIDDSLHYDLCIRIGFHFNYGSASDSVE